MIVLLYLYPISLAVISAFVALLEYLFPWRKDQKQLRPGLFSDFLHLVFNGHFLGVILFGVATYYVLPPLDKLLGQYGLTTVLYRNAAASWPIWAQILVALFVVDFIQWGVHNLLHRVPFLWEFHKGHHSVEDGEMDWIVSFRFQWVEVVVYKSILYFPLAFFGFAPAAILFHAIFGTLIGHLNHANLDLGHGWWRYILNNPRMHIWHHYYEGDEKTTVNFGIIFSIWDWVFGTAKVPDEPPPKLGFHGVEEFPKNFLGQEVWPLQKLLPQSTSSVMKIVAGVAGAALIAFAWWFHKPPTKQFATPMLGEKSASSQPQKGKLAPASAYAKNAQEATKALESFGETARKAGFAHPKVLVSIAELAAALGSPRLVVLDVRPRKRFRIGHIPSAQPVERKDFLAKTPFPGLSRSAQELQAMLRSKGVNNDSIVVLYTDGGPEHFRLWWTLRQVANFDTRILDGGLNNWKAAGHGIAEGDPKPAKAGSVTLKAVSPKPPQLWKELAALTAKHKHISLIDTRSKDEYTGKKQHRKSVRAGHIPNAKHLEWYAVIRSKQDRRLRPVKQLKEIFAPLRKAKDTFFVVYCQSGTRSAAHYFALMQLGIPTERILNYDGSWAEYSRQKELPVAKGS